MRLPVSRPADAADPSTSSRCEPRALGTDADLRSFLFTILSIPVALAPNIACWLAFRFITGALGSSFLSVVRRARLRALLTARLAAA